MLKFGANIDKLLQNSNAVKIKYTSSVTGKGFCNENWHKIFMSHLDLFTLWVDNFVTQSHNIIRNIVLQFVYVLFPKVMQLCKTISAALNSSCCFRLSELVRTTANTCEKNTLRLTNDLWRGTFRRAYVHCRFAQPEKHLLYSLTYALF